jgi:2Fe-2S ferredoxin
MMKEGIKSKKGFKGNFVVRETVSLTFLPQNVMVTAQSGDTILDAALDNGIPLPHECGGNCACTTCHVLVLAGIGNVSIQEDVETDRLTSADGLTAASRLGCQAILQGGNVAVRIVETA